MEYIILKANMDKLAELVNGYIAQGWRPQGGVSALGGSYWGLQAMIRG